MTVGMWLRYLMREFGSCSPTEAKVKARIPTVSVFGIGLKFTFCLFCFLLSSPMENANLQMFRFYSEVEPSTLCVIQDFCPIPTSCGPRS